MTQQIEGVYAAALTPLNDDLSCNTKELALHCKDLLHRGCKGIVLFGTTGEGASFSVEERVNAIRELIQLGLYSKQLIVCNGSSNIPETATLLQSCLEMNVTASLVAPPSYFKNVSEEGVIAYYREIVQRVNNKNLKIILYHIPQNTGVPITLPIIHALRSAFPETFVGIKESEGNLDFTKAIIESIPDFGLFIGKEKHIAQGAHYGAKGVICGIANLCPELVCKLYELGKQGSIENSGELEEISEPLRKGHFVPAMKAILAKKRGPLWQAVRPPLMSLSPHNTSMIQACTIQA